MANRAAQELQALRMDTAEVEDAATALARVTPDQPNQAPVGDEAKFGAPEAIATAMFASVLLGPLGGITVGIAQGLLKKRSDQTMLEQIEKRENAWTNSGDIIENKLVSMRELAVNPQDLGQIDALQVDYDIAREYAKSGDDALMAKAVQLMDGIGQGIKIYERDQETDRVALEAQVKSDERQLGLDQQNILQPMQRDFDAQSAPWQERMFAVNLAMEGLREGTPAQLNTAMIMLNKALDPNSAVLIEEKESIARMGTIFDRVFNLVSGGLETGNPLNADQRRDIFRALETIRDTSTADQSRRESRFQERAEEDLGAGFIDRFSLVKNRPAAVPLNIPDDVKKVSNQLPPAAAEKLEQAVVNKQFKKDQQIVKDLAAGFSASSNELMESVSAGSKKMMQSAIERIRKDHQQIMGRRRTN